ncbi:MAG: TonB-dependent receptor [Asticcacaulis sp.]|uniref:TonB-dependent receptor n=1 Tax=Asticcacaulis sp. TaxID=1872648 RepID=UPI0039E64FD0
MTDRSSVSRRASSSTLVKFGLTAAVSALALGVAFHAGAQEATTAASAPADDNTVVIVKGVRASITKSLSNKRRATQVVESVVAEDIGKLPDNNVVEALQRVTGVQVTNRSAGEVGTVTIRGLPDVATTWNGRNVFTASGQSFALADIPSNLVRQIDVYKTRSSDQLETGLAGQIDVKTLRPFDFKGAEISIAARGIYLEPADTFNPNISLLASNRWSTSHGDFGALIDLSYAKTKYRDESVTPGALVPFLTEDDVPAGWVPLERIFNTDARASEALIWQPGQLMGLSSEPGSTLNINGTPYKYYLSRDAIFQSDLLGERERPAANIALQWQPNADAIYTFEAMYAGYRNTTYNSLLFSFVDWWGNPGAVTTFPGTNILKTRVVNNVYGFNSGDLTTNATDSYVYALNGKWNIGDKLTLTGDLAYQSSVFHSEFTAQRIDRVANQITVDFNDHDGIAAFSFDDNSLLTDPTQWNVAQFYDNANRNEGSATTAQLDGVYSPDHWGPVVKLSFGGRADVRRASEANRGQNSYLGRNLATMPEGWQFVNSDFFDGYSDVPRSWMEANGYYMRDHIDEVRELYHSVDPNFKTTDQLSLFKNFEVNESTQSLYVMADTDNQLFGNRLRGQFGLRYVTVDTDMTFYDQATATQASASKHADRLMPSVTLRYDFTDQFDMRFNYGETLRRPNFGDLNPNHMLTDDLTGVGYGTATGGNPDLEPTHAKNIDLTAEWYFTRDSAVYGTLFHREIDGLVVPLLHIETIANTTANTDKFLINTPVNASDGTLDGYELGLTYFPKNLPGLLDGFGLQASITGLRSSQNVPYTDAAGNIIGELKNSFFAVSDFSYNVTLAYQRGPVGARLSYVWRKEFLNNNEASLFANPLGVWRNPESSLDFQLNYDINDKMSVSIDAVNLTDEKMQPYYAFGSAGGPETDDFGTLINGRQFAIGFRWKY